jgi:hypothetical protein
MIRANVATIPGMPWRPDDPYGPFLPYHDSALDHVLADRYDALGTLEPATFGRAFYEHYRVNGYEFPGREFAIAESWATPHDSLHVLSGYSTSAQGELLVAAFTGGMLRRDVDLMESHVLPTILIYHLGIDINKGLNAGDRARIAADPSWRDNYDGNVHLGLDAEKLWVAWSRGRAMTADVYSGHWSFWDHIETRSTSCATAGACHRSSRRWQRCATTRCSASTSPAPGCRSRRPCRPCRSPTGRPATVGRGKLDA